MNEHLEKFFNYCDNSGLQNLHRYGNYIKRPDKIKSLSEAREYDKKAVCEIEELKQKIGLLQIYREELYNRFQEINSANYHKRITLKREWRYTTNNQHKVFYYLLIENVPDRHDVENIQLRYDCYEEKQRHEAIKMFELLCRQNPQAEIVKDIDKKHWEK